MCISVTKANWDTTVLSLAPKIMFGKKFIDYSIREEDRLEYSDLLQNDLAGIPYQLDDRGGGSILAPRDDNLVVYLEIAASGGRRLPNGGVTQQQVLGRLHIELRSDLVPVAAANFKALCSGIKGVGEDGVRYHYKGIRIHRIIKDLFFQSGDLMDTGGNFSKSIYSGQGGKGFYFKDENFIFRHTGAGCVSCCNRGPDTNGSLFQICFNQNADLDGRNVVFGCLASDESFRTLTKINSYGTRSGEPKEEIRIIDCGVAFQK